jgi:hypothetical protein
MPFVVDDAFRLVRFNPLLRRREVRRGQKLRQQLQVVLPAHAGYRGDETDRRARRKLVLLQQAVDEIPVAEEVDCHQVGCPVGNAGGREHGVNRTVQLLERGVDRCGIAQVHLDGLGNVILHRRVIQHDDFGAQLRDGLGRRRAHAGRAADNERALTVVAQTIDDRHGNPLLDNC